MSDPIPTLFAALLITSLVAFCWRTYRTTDDAAIRVASFTLTVLGAGAVFYVAYIRFLFSPCLRWW